MSLLVLLFALFFVTSARAENIYTPFPEFDGSYSASTGGVFYQPCCEPSVPFETPALAELESITLGYAARFAEQGMTVASALVWSTNPSGEIDGGWGLIRSVPVGEIRKIDGLWEARFVMTFTVGPDEWSPVGSIPPPHVLLKNGGFFTLNSSDEVTVSDSWLVFSGQPVPEPRSVFVGAISLVAIAARRLL